MLHAITDSSEATRSIEKTLLLTDLANFASPLNPIETQYKVINI
jgi:hypothetical protein